MRHLINKFNRLVLVIATTVFSVFCSLLLLFIIYQLLGVEIRPSEILAATLAPLLIASSVTYYLFGLLKELNFLEKKMRALANYDHLTNLLTRRAFLERAEYYFNIAKREEYQFSLLMVDLDYFKKINDTFGHSAGDYILKEFAEVINQNKREADLIGRFGGEEFIFLLWGTPSSGVTQYTNSLHDKLKNTKFQYNSNDIQFSISIGASCFSTSNNVNDLMVIIDQADQALYSAKQTGRNKTILFNDIKSQLPSKK